MLLESAWSELATPTAFYSAIRHCAKDDNIECLQKILKRHSDWSAVFSNHRLLHTAARHRSFLCLEAMAQAGAFLGSRGKGGTTLLTDAVEYDDLAMCGKLLALGADPNDNETDPLRKSWSPLDTAVFRKRFVIAKRLIAAGARPDSYNGHGGTPLGFLATTRLAADNAEFVADVFALAQALLDAGAHVDLPDEEGMTPLMLACRNDNALFAGFLLSRGAEPTRSGPPPPRRLGRPLAFAWPEAVKRQRFCSSTTLLRPRKNLGMS
jgi:ankyrin repeat protein